METFLCNRTLIMNVAIVLCEGFIIHKEIETMVLHFDHRPERDTAPIALKQKQ